MESIFNKKALRVLFVFVMTANVLDAVSTLYGITAGKIETNSLLLSFAHHIGFIPALISVKVVTTAMIAWIYGTAVRENSYKEAQILLFIIAIVYSFVVLNNSL